MQTPLDSFKSLPIYNFKEKILNFVSSNREKFLAITGSTGSGKSTFVPSLLFDFYPNKKIVVTQPRRVAATSLAVFLATRFGENLGGPIGYHVRFDKKSTDRTVLTVMTDGMLVQRLLRRSSLQNCAFLVLDEVHERSVDSDILLLLLKRTLQQNRALKVVLMSATLNFARLQRWLECDIATLTVPTATFPVELRFLPKPSKDWLRSLLNTLDKLETTRGKVLVFLPGKDFIKNAAAAIADRFSDRFVVHSLHGALSLEEQTRLVQQKSASCSVLLSTNVAETSLTVRDVVVVVDCGLAKKKTVERSTETLKLVPVSKFEAVQRAGRAGRERTGTCYCLYTQEAYASLQEEPVAQLLEADLAETVLKLRKLRVPFSEFSFLDQPAVARWKEALVVLVRLHAINPEGNLTREGERLMQLQVHPKLGKVLLNAVKQKPLNRVLLATLLRAVVLLGTEEELEFSVSAEKGKGELYSALVSFQENKKLQKAFQQLRKNTLRVCNKNIDLCALCKEDIDRVWNELLKQLLVVYAENVAIKKTGNVYEIVCDKRTVFLPKTSKVTNECIFFHKVFVAGKPWAKFAEGVDKEWLAENLSTHYRLSYECEEVQKYF